MDRGDEWTVTHSINTVQQQLGDEWTEVTSWLKENKSLATASLLKCIKAHNCLKFGMKNF